MDGDKKILITGGAGFLGINLARFLLKKGCEVVSLDIAPFDYLEKNQVKCITGDVRNVKDVEEATHNVYAVVHTAAALPLYSKEDIFSTEVNGTKNILDAVIKNKIPRIVHISSTAVYGIPDHHPIYETDKLQGVGPYGEAKILAEELCKEARKKGAIVPILRPKSFIGPERLGVFALFYDWASTGCGFPMIGNGKNKYQLLDVEDLCEAIWLTLTLPEEKVNDTFNIGARNFLTMREDYQAVLDHAGFGKKIIGLPAAPMIWTLRFLEILHLSPLYKWVYETAGKDSFVSIEKAESILGYTPKYSNKDALVRNFEWYLENKNKFGDISGVSHRVPWKQGILKFAKYFF
ncbi:NAD-dependent epimerase/dehydratase family protein [Candidatus Giovannonibacteria bacterium]|nr:NAD-dependent epimerase/dehydratase family protein [Candidatus Giovannonibacteria bacterium]